MKKVMVKNSQSFEQIKPTAFTESIFNRLAPAAEGPGHCCGLLNHFPFGEPGKVRRGAWELRCCVSGGSVRPREQEEAKEGRRGARGGCRGRSSHDSPLLGSGSFHKSRKSRGPVNDFHIEEQRSTCAPTVQFPESQHQNHQQTQLFLYPPSP